MIHKHRLLQSAHAIEIAKDVHSRRYNWLRRRESPENPHRRWPENMALPLSPLRVGQAGIYGSYLKQARKPSNGWRSSAAQARAWRISGSVGLAANLHARGLLFSRPLTLQCTSTSATDPPKAISANIVRYQCSSAGQIRTLINLSNVPMTRGRQNLRTEPP